MIVNMGVNILILTLLTVCGSYVVSGEKNILCYYGTWATDRAGFGQFNVEHINPFLCTHLIYTFVGINTEGTVISLDTDLDLPDGRNNFAKFNALKEQNPKLKTLLAVGGWNEGSAKYSAMSADATLRQNFINSALEMVTTYGFDGFDLDWEYPNRRDTVHGIADIDNFSTLVKEMKEVFEERGLLLTAAVSSVRDAASLSYDVPAICKYLDFINLMSYDMHGAWDVVTGHNAPLHGGEGDENTPYEDLYTVDNAVDYWLDSGCPTEKLVVGVPFYGRSFTLTDANNNGVRAPSSGAGIAGPYTVSAGSLGYNEFCVILQTESWDVRYDNLAKVPYAVQGNNWVTYDNPASITKKVEYALSKNIRNIMMWSIETDDFHGLCGENFALLRTINRVLDGVEESVTSTTESEVTATEEPATTVKPTTSTTTTAAPSTTTAAWSTITPETATAFCIEEGFATIPNSCSSFAICIRDFNGQLIAKKFECPAGTLWDSNKFYCNYEYEVKC